MLLSVSCALLLWSCLLVPRVLLEDLAFRCPGCTAERLNACPKLPAPCSEMVREPGCGCCPVCARLEGELCGVYTPRCSTGLMCYPSASAELPLQELIQGLGRCGHRVDLDDATTNQEATNGRTDPGGAGTEGPINTLFNCILDFKSWMAENFLQLNQDKTEVLTVGPEAQRDRLEAELQTHSLGSSERVQSLAPPLFYGLCCVFVCLQCNMSVHGQRGECWCVNPLTGDQIPATPRVRGDPNCYRFHEEVQTVPHLELFNT
uniref:Insulin-like growth factor binding protein 2b n=1 Tax=Sphaeramia orbicularis TaxID=375764 RepID=A0A672YFS9_9TELE